MFSKISNNIILFLHVILLLILYGGCHKNFNNNKITSSTKVKYSGNWNYLDSIRNQILWRINCLSLYDCQNFTFYTPNALSELTQPGEFLYIAPTLFEIEITSMESTIDSIKVGFRRYYNSYDNKYCIKDPRKYCIIFFKQNLIPIKFISFSKSWQLYERISRDVQNDIINLNHQDLCCLYNYNSLLNNWFRKEIIKRKLLDSINSINCKTKEYYFTIDAFLGSVYFKNP